MGIKIDRVVLRQIRMPLVHFFETSFGRTMSATSCSSRSSADGISGWGEITAGENPFYNEEWTTSVWSFGAITLPPDTPSEVPFARQVRRCTDIFAATIWPSRNGGCDLGRAGPLKKSLSGKRSGAAQGREIPWAYPSAFRIPSRAAEKIETELDAGYQRIKMKIKPGWDVDVIRRVRERFPRSSSWRTQIQPILSRTWST